MASLVCQACGTAVGLDEPIPRDSECSGCRRDLRCCMNCRHYDTRYNNSCRETMADPVEDKARRNFCEYFSFNRAPFQSAVAGSGSKEADARAKLAALFGGPAAAAAPPPGDARSKPGRLFGAPPARGDREADARRKLDALFDKPKQKPPDPGDE